MILRRVLIMIATAASFATLAQESGFGIKAGVNLTTLDIKDAEASYDSRTGYHAGIFVRGKFNRVALQPEVLLFTQRGERVTTFGSFEESFTYLSVPIIFKIYPVAGLNLQLGPQFGFLIDGEQEFQNGLIKSTRDITDAYKGSDVSVSLGGGYDFDFGLSLDFRYNVGVKDLNNLADQEEAKSRIFMVSLGWNFLQ